MRFPGERVRIGFGLGTNSSTNDGVRLAGLCADLERCGFDSIWFAERVAGHTLDPIVAMAYAAAVTRKLKFGPSVTVLPGRNPVLLATAFASLDRVSGGRLLPSFGLGAVNLGEHQAFGVERGDRAAWFDEALPLIRRLWAEDSVDHDGDRFHLSGVTVRPKPIQDPLEVWLGGSAPSELRRTGRLADGWLPAFCTAADVDEGIPVIDEHAAAAGREPLDRGHFGALIAYTTDGSLPDRIVQAVRARRPDLDPDDVIVRGRDRLGARISEFVDAGATKFVVMPFTEPDDWSGEIEALGEAVLHLQA